MASGLAALLDDIAGIAKIAAASVDDMAGAAGKASSKAIGVVIDDTAVTPRYAVGFTPDRELPIVLKIAIGSFRNKFIFILPGALLLSAFASWAVTPLLMVGATYLLFEATEKVLETAHHDHEGEEPENLAQSSEELEHEKVGGAIRTDLILSSEIMAIGLADVAERPFLIQAAALAVVAILLTVGVYGVVALIIKLDDIGLHLSQKKSKAVAAFGRGLVQAMPAVLHGLSVIGTAAMLWVGGGIIVHGLEKFGVEPVAHIVHAIERWAGQPPVVGGFTSWLVMALISAVIGFIIGLPIVGAVHAIKHRVGKHL